MEEFFARMNALDEQRADIMRKRAGLEKTAKVRRDFESKYLEEQRK